VQAEQHRVERQRRLQLAQDLVAHGLVVGPVGRPRRAGGKAAALDQREVFGGGTAAGDEQRRRAHARRIVGMLARPEEHALLVGGEPGRQRREGVGLGGKRGREEAHVRCPQESCDVRYSASDGERRLIPARAIFDSLHQVFASPYAEGLPSA
jgi:hypothetical protein